MTPSSRCFVPSVRLVALALLLAGCGGDGGGGGGGGGPNVPPTVTMTGPSSNVALLAGDLLAVEFTADDDDDNATVRVLADVDGNPATTGDQTVLHNGVDSNGTTVLLNLATTGLGTGSYTLFTIVDDGENPPVLSSAPGFLIVYPGLAGVAPPRSNTYGVTGPHVVFAVGEGFQPGPSLNPPDADLGDAVMAVLDSSTAVLVQGTIDADTTGVDIAGTARVLSGELGVVPWHRLEADAGNLNGDLDANDVFAAYVMPSFSLTTFFHPKAGALIKGRGGPARVAVRYVEAAQGVAGTDMDADGDALDEVIAMLVPQTNALVTFTLATLPGTPFRESGTHAAFYLAEAAQGLDYNLDGDQIDTMLARFQIDMPLAGGPTAFAGLQGAPPQPARTVDGTAAFDVTDAAGGFLAYYIDEALSGGGLSLNGDADATDFIPAVYSLAAFKETIPGAGLNYGPGGRIMIADGSKVFFVAKEEGVDQNLDGDAGADQEMLWWVDLAAPGVATVLNPGAAVAGRTGIAVDGGQVVLLSPGHLGIVAVEAVNAVDMNGDLDILDRIVLIVDTTTPVPTVHNTQTMGSPGGNITEPGVASSNGVLLRCQEGANGDLNGDLDTSDTLFVFFDFAAPTTRVLLDTTGGDHAWVAGGVIGVTANEALGGADLNGDVDTNDFHFVAFDTTGTKIGGPILSASFSVPASDDGTVWAFLRNEFAEGRSLNGDGDSTDFVLGVWLKP